MLINHIELGGRKNTPQCRAKSCDVTFENETKYLEWYQLSFTIEIPYKRQGNE